MRAFLFLMLASCTHDIAVVDRVADIRTARDLDILYVFDNSPDHASYSQMASQLDVLQTRLEEVDDQLPNLHVGVVTTDLGTRGTLDAAPGPAIGNCFNEGRAGKLVTFQAGVDNAFLSDTRAPDGTRKRNYSSGDLTAELALLTNPDPGGAANTGCEFAQPLEAMRRALDPATNPGFIRAGAMLQIVFLTNEDDCSLARAAMLDPNNAALGSLPFRCTEQGVICDPDQPRKAGAHQNCRPREGSEFMVDVSEYQAFLEQYKPDSRDVIVSAVAGARTPFAVRDLGVPVLSPSCTGASGSAKPAVRIGSLVDSFGGVIVDSCTQDSAYQQLASPIISAQRSCFPNLRKAEAEETCRVIEIAGTGAETELAPCTAGNASPCWYSYADAKACPAGDNIGIALHRGTTVAPVGSRINATCFVK